MKSSLATATAVVLLCLSMVGCSSLRLHSETREKQGQAASKAWEEVDLNGFFDAERANQARLLEQQRASSAKLVALNKESLVRVLIDDRTTISQIPPRIDDLLVAFVGGTAQSLDQNGGKARSAVEKSIKDASKAFAQKRGALDALETTYSQLAELSVPQFTCGQLAEWKASDRNANSGASIVGAWLKRNPLAPSRTKPLLGNAAENCGKSEEADQATQSAIDAMPDDAALRSTQQETKRVAESIKTKQGAADEQTKQYEAALAAYSQEMASAKPGTPATDKAKKLAEDVGLKLDAIKQVGSLFSDRFVSEERLARIDALLSSLKAGEPLDSVEASNLELTIAVLPIIADDIRAVRQAKAGKAAVALLIQRDVEQARLNAAKVGIAADQKRLSLQVSSLQQGIANADTLISARKRFFPRAPKDPGKPPAPFVPSSNKSIDEAWGSLSGPQKAELLKGLSEYLDVFARKETQANELAMRRLALDNEEAIARAEVNANMWAALIGATVTQATEYSALGIKASDIEPILNLLGLLYIGHGVNK